MKRCLYLFLSIIFIFCLVGCAKPSTTSSSKPVEKTATPVTHTIKAPKAGKILGLIAEKGERISKDQPLFAMQDEALSSQMIAISTEIAKEEAKLKVMQTGIPASTPVNLAALKAQQETAQKKAEKMNSLYAIGGVSRKQAEAAQQELAQANQALASAGKQTSTKPATKEEQDLQAKKITALKEQQNKIRTQLQANEVVCPATSIVKEVKVKNGDQVQTGQTILILEESQE